MGQKFANAESSIITETLSWLLKASWENEINMGRCYNVYCAGDTNLDEKKALQFVWTDPVMLYLSLEKNPRTWTPVSVGSKKGHQTLGT